MTNVENAKWYRESNSAKAARIIQDAIDAIAKLDPENDSDRNDMDATKFALCDIRDEVKWAKQSLAPVRFKITRGA